jgi:glycosyltransferase involved in cell wall biosynthesis
MLIIQTLILWAYFVIVVIWVIRQLYISRVYKKQHVLTRSSGKYRGPDFPLVSAIIPARDEEKALPACLDSVRGQTYSKLEIIVADDRSVDGTAEVVRRAAAEDPRVRLVSITDLPEGWTGKTHALQVATAEANGKWFWYVDADTIHSPDSLSIAMSFADLQGGILVSVLPESRCETFWEKVLQPLEGIVLLRSYPLQETNRDDTKGAFANGQYMLIIRGAYYHKAVGGHAAVRDRFVEDIHLARRVKSAGLRVLTAVTTDISSVRMYHSLPELVRGWARILYDALDRDPRKIAWKIAEPLIFSQSGDIALVASIVLLSTGTAVPFAWRLLGLSLVHQILKQTLLVRLYAWSAPRTARYALLYPLAGIVSAWISLKAILMCYTGRVRWRGTEYRRPAQTSTAAKVG